MGYSGLLWGFVAPVFSGVERYHARSTFEMEGSNFSVRYIPNSHFDGILVFFQDLFKFLIHCNKIHIFLCLFVLFAHYYHDYW